MAKVLIDANVIISAAFGGNPLRAVIRVMEEDDLYLSQAVERELTEIFSKLWAIEGRCPLYSQLR